ncbi:MAG TPA: DUF4167 domain-containing protein [Hyphomonas sp.]|nr:DUF4167 domain-containing protein [Hyphomonas sp.]HPF22822.1 DUF4167 domain-containing protein [Hyphomonas sp.]HRX73053.1 DUF4167 domain-containing protein [Hyphomonas sp.]
MKRSRGRNRRTGGNNQNNFNNPNRHFESVGPDVKIRGSAQQVLEKYQQYARDAQTSGDRILSEAYFQFAEHYQRIVAKQQEARDRQQQPRGGRDDRDQGRRDDRDNSRNDPEDDAAETSNDEAESVDVRVERRDADERKNKDDSDDDAMRVIDAGEASDEAPAETGAGDRDKEDGRRRGRRRPYKARDEDASGDAADPADGVMKTLSRGRRKPADEGAEAPAETTD